ncbi:MAG TPA: NAD(P)H-dependent oxidoreductase [Kofleriaceae bacterium]|nr:NAD(P)H-dependent oxidoreductase [Kofleriaceae bacterium]
MDRRAVRVIVVVYHSASGRTEALAQAIARGAGGTTMSVSQIDHDVLARAEAIVFGCPTYMGSASAAFKQFMDDTAAIWGLQGWRDKLAAGFTHSAAPSGDKLGTLTQLAVFAAQHGMVWVGLGLPPTYATTGAATDDTNRLGSHLGLMAQTAPGASLHAGDLRTAEGFGRRIADAVSRWRRPEHDAPAARTQRHPLARHWPEPIGAMNLRELASRPERFEHHLVVFARIGGAQLEVATASEPLYFGHRNISDEFALALPTGDDLVDRFPLRTFVSDTRGDVGRYNHRTGELVLHPLGFMHWPGRLRPPYEMPVIPPGMRRCVLSLVYCANVPTPSTPAPHAAEPTDGRVKAYVTPAPPLSLVDVRTQLGVIAAVGATTLAVATGTIAPPRGGWVVDLETLEVHRLGPGDRLELARALVFSSPDVEPDPIPPAWHALPEPPFAPLEDVARGTLPFTYGPLSVVERDDAVATVTLEDAIAEVPRHWLARTLFRLGLHDLRLGQIETYGGMSFDDHAGGDLDVGVGRASFRIDRADALPFIERLYRAVAPPGYTERIG